MKLRTFEVIGARTFQRAGAAPIQMSWADVVPALTTGAIEAVLTSDEGGANAKFWDVGAKFFNAFGYSQGVSVVTMNKAEFGKLAPDMQKALLDAAAVAEKHAWDAIRERTAKNKKMISDAGGTFIDTPPAAVIDHLRQAATPELETWKSSVGAAANEILAAYAKARIKS
jgi:TRAP-type C4-dicarboxylate transport system substrate-binding protein